MKAAGQASSRFKRRSVIPGFGVTFGYSLFYLGLIVRFDELVYRLLALVCAYHGLDRRAHRICLRNVQYYCCSSSCTPRRLDDAICLYFGRHL